jgi:hypothetical protein
MNYTITRTMAFWINKHYLEILTDTERMAMMLPNEGLTFGTVEMYYTLIAQPTIRFLQSPIKEGKFSKPLSIGDTVLDFVSAGCNVCQY